MRLSQKLRPLAALAFAAPWASNCSADWQFTLWGMSPQQVVEASKGTVKETGSSEAIKAKGIYSTDAIEFDAVFYFGESGLSQVGLAASDDGKCAAAKSALVARYGTPTTSNPESVAWRSAGTGDFVEWTSLSKFKRSGAAGGACFITYRPLSTAGAGM
jgi:hypothetical protein